MSSGIYFLWYLLKLITTSGDHIKIKQVQISVGEVFKFWSFWGNVSKDAFRVIGSKPVFEDLNLSTEIQFSTHVGHLSTHLVYFYWSLSSNKKSQTCLGSWHLTFDNDTCERSNTSEFEIKGNTAICQSD